MENSQKMVVSKLVCCHGNILQHTHVNEKDIPGKWLIITVNARSLNPKVETNSSFLVLHPSLGVHTVNTVGSHLKRHIISHSRSTSSACSILKFCFRGQAFTNHVCNVTPTLKR